MMELSRKVAYTNSSPGELEPYGPAVVAPKPIISQTQMLLPLTSLARANSVPDITRQAQYASQATRSIRRQSSAPLGTGKCSSGSAVSSSLNGVSAEGASLEAMPLQAQPPVTNSLTLANSTRMRDLQSFYSQPYSRPRVPKRSQQWSEGEVLRQTTSLRPFTWYVAELNDTAVTDPSLLAAMQRRLVAKASGAEPQSPTYIRQEGRMLMPTWPSNRRTRSSIYEFVESSEMSHPRTPHRAGPLIVVNSQGHCNSTAWSPTRRACIRVAPSTAPMPEHPESILEDVDDSTIPSPSDSSRSSSSLLATSRQTGVAGMRHVTASASSSKSKTRVRYSKPELNVFGAERIACGSFASNTPTILRTPVRGARNSRASRSYSQSQLEPPAMGVSLMQSTNTYRPRSSGTLLNYSPLPTANDEIPQHYLTTRQSHRHQRNSNHGIMYSSISHPNLLITGETAFGPAGWRANGQQHRSEWSAATTLTPITPISPTRETGSLLPVPATQTIDNEKRKIQRRLRHKSRVKKLQRSMERRRSRDMHHPHTQNTWFCCLGDCDCVDPVVKIIIWVVFGIVVIAGLIGLPLGLRTMS